ncbi:monocarboxylate transporter 12-like isoform X2 [Ostrea edulis]|uniref:monocarboxylate transporter 12-like isoform X2 n=1 Tax=Ostrea edulis TaxID=37623 RepID=UPI002094D049|nr:monocarboxylate transporter 12-like isoform X2 [Ostrea edulis]XP_056005634.1 monocarboxylate transporter 12-like isoform X2 [Ostrea edulis]
MVDLRIFREYAPEKKKRAPLAGVLVNKFGWRVVSFGGGLLTCCGLLLSTLSTNLFMLCLFYGVVTGAGLGIAYMGGSLAVPRYFQHKKIQNLAVGVASAGGGIGTFIFPPIIRFLDNEYGWKGMFMILAGISLNICVFGLLYRPLPNKDENKNPTRKKRRSSTHVPEPNDWSFLKSSVFHFVAMNNFLYAFGASIIYGHLAAYAEFHMHLNKNEAAVLYSVIGISVTIAKVTQGLVADFHKVHPIFKAINQYILFYFLGGLATLLLLVDTGYAGLLVYCVFFGASSAANGGSLIPAILMEIFGQTKLSLPYGVVLAEMSIGHVLGAPAAGWMYEHGKNYHHPFIVASVSMILSAVVMWYPRRYLMSPRETLMILDIESPTEEEKCEKYFDEKESSEATRFIRIKNAKCLQSPNIEKEATIKINHNHIKGDVTSFLIADEKEIQRVEENMTEMTTLISSETDVKTGNDTDIPN